MPTAEEFIKNSSGGDYGDKALETPGTYEIACEYVGEEDAIGPTAKNAGKPLYKTRWEEVNGEGSLWDNFMIVESLDWRIAQQWIGLGGDSDRQFSDVDDIADACLAKMRAGATAYVEVGWGKASGGYPAKLEIKRWLPPESGKTVVGAKKGRDAPTDEEEVPF